MTEFLYEAGLFSFKAFSLIVIFGLFLLSLSAFILARKNLSRESIEIEKINDKLEEFKKCLEQETLSKQELKFKKKFEKKQEKLEAKKEKQRLKHLKKQASQNNALLTTPKLFVLRFDGDIYANEVETLRGAITAILTLATQDDEVLLILDSPGGIVHSYGLAASQLERIKSRQIKLVVAVDLVAASGGYMMASVADKIIAAPFAVVGSIGVLAQLPNFNRLLKKHDVDIEQHTAGEYKTTLTLLGENTDKSRAKFQEDLNATHDLFKEFVHQNRPSVEIDKIATGEHWYAKQALALNLVDEILTSDDYLLEKSKDLDIFEISYVIEESLKEKISNALQYSLEKIIKRFFPSLLF